MPLNRARGVRKRFHLRHTFYLLLMALALGAAGFFLVMLRPWHQGKLIVLISTVCFAVVWLSARSRLVRTGLSLLTAVSCMVSVAAAVWWYQEVFKPHHPSALSSIQEPGATRQKLHDRLISSAQQYQRPRVLDYQNYELGTTALGASRHEFAFEGQAPVRLPSDLSWRENPSQDRSWGFNLHAMGFIERLAEEYRRTREDKWLVVAESYVLDWISDNHDVWFWYPSEFSWHDHATALRLRAWMAFWQIWIGSSLATAEKSGRVLDAMLAHATRLADPHFYTDSHNHGIDQDIALLEFSFLFPQLDGAAAWRDLSVRRLQKQMSATISKDGVHLEHSPGYHLQVCKLLLEISELSRLNDPTIAQRLDVDATVARMADFLSWILMPNGDLPRLGDTDTENVADDPKAWSMLANRSELLRSFISGRPRDGVALYRTEGYVVDRRSSGPSLIDASYMIFTGAANAGMGHKHHDELSFVWYAYGKELLSDAGKYTYNYTDPIRKWIISSAAHNTVLVDGRGFDGFRATIEEVFHDETLTLIQASHRSFPAIEHVRRLVYIRPALIFVLDDLKIVSATDTQPHQHRFEQLFHLGSEMTEVLTQGKRDVSVASGPQADRIGVLVQSLSPEHVVRRTTEGQSDPLQGWISLRHGSLQRAKVISFEAAGAGASFVTALRAFRSNDEALRFSDSVALNRDGSNVAISWRDEAGQHVVRLPVAPTRPSWVQYQRAPS